MTDDPTNSRYRTQLYRSKTSYRRFVNGNREIQPAIPDLKDIKIPPHGSYGELLFRSEWKSKRKQIIDRDGQCCVICQGKYALQVHHRQYHFVVRENKFKMPWDYPDHLMITLCEPCHNRGHNKFTVPTIHT